MNTPIARSLIKEKVIRRYVEVDFNHPLAGKKTHLRDKDRRNSESKMIQDDRGIKGVSAVVPAHNEEEHITKVVEAAEKSEYVDEVIVVDDGSEDNTAAEIKDKATVIKLDQNHGKGHALKKGTEEAKGEIIVFLDADLKNISGEKIDNLIKPIREADFVIAKFDREGGRVTELTAKPLLSTFFPEIDVEQPLSGQKVVKKKLLDRIDIVNNYGVDVGMLIDAAMLGARIKEASFGKLRHDMKELDELVEVAEQVNETILYKAQEYGRLENAEDIEVKTA
jgi:glycosyltransferase involved in cell wall biosynthesis